MFERGGTWKDLGWGVRASARVLKIGSHGNHRIAPIESVKVTREPLFMAVPLAAAMVFGAFNFFDILYAREILLLLGGGLALLAGGASIAGLEITSKAQTTRVMTRPVWVVMRTCAAVNERLDALESEKSRSFFIDYGDDHE